MAEGITVPPRPRVGDIKVYRHCNTGGPWQRGPTIFASKKRAGYPFRRKRCLLRLMANYLLRSCIEALQVCTSGDKCEGRLRNCSGQKKFMEILYGKRLQMGMHCCKLMSRTGCTRGKTYMLSNRAYVQKHQKGAFQ